MLPHAGLDIRSLTHKRQGGVANTHFWKQAQAIAPCPHHQLLVVIALGLASSRRPDDLNRCTPWRYWTLPASATAGRPSSTISVGGRQAKTTAGRAMTQAAMLHMPPRPHAVRCGTQLIYLIGHRDGWPHHPSPETTKQLAHPRAQHNHGLANAPLTLKEGAPGDRHHPWDLRDSDRAVVYRRRPPSNKHSHLYTPLLARRSQRGPCLPTPCRYDRRLHPPPRDLRDADACRMPRYRPACAAPTRSGATTLSDENVCSH